MKKNTSHKKTNIYNKIDFAYKDYDAISEISSLGLSLQESLNLHDKFWIYDSVATLDEDLFEKKIENYLSSFSRNITSDFYDTYLQNLKKLAKENLSFVDCVTKYVEDYITSSDIKEICERYYEQLHCISSSSRVCQDSTHILHSKVIINVPAAKDDFYAVLSNCLSDDVFIDGESSQTEKFMLDRISEFGAESTMSLLMEFFKKNYSNVHFTCGILHALSHMPYESVGISGEYMAIAAFQHKDIEVREFALKAFDSWKSKESLLFLESINCDLPWMQEYLVEIIANIKES